MAEARFVIDGAEYPIPGLETFNMDEAVVLYECCGLTLEDFAIDDGDSDQIEELERKTRHPGFVKALMVVAFMRGEKKTAKAALKLVGSSNLVEILAAIDAEDEAEDPTEPQKSKRSKRPSPGSSDSNGDSSGDGSPASSDAEKTSPASTPESTVSAA